MAQVTTLPFWVDPYSCGQPSCQKYVSIFMLYGGKNPAEPDPAVPETKKNGHLVSSTDVFSSNKGPATEGTTTSSSYG